MKQVTTKYLERVEELAPFLADADHVDVKTVKAGNGALLNYVARILTYEPKWVVWLYTVRKHLARIMGLLHADLDISNNYTPENVPVTPGEKAGFLEVEMHCPHRLWVASASDKHLMGYMAVLLEPSPKGGGLLHLATIVRYRNWQGPLYFNLIRPFHHLIVATMVRHAVKED